MDTQKLHEAAKKEGGEHDFAALLQAGLQDDVTAATVKLATENAKLKTSVGKLEVSGNKAMDELKPLQKVLKAAEMGWKSGDELVLLGERLKTGGKPTEDALRLAEKLAGPMAEEGLKELKVEKETLEAKLAEAVKGTEAAVLRGDRKELDLRVQAAQMGKGKPRLIGTHAETFVSRFIEPYMQFEDVEVAGKTVRSPVARHGEVPIMTSKGQASVSDLIATAYEGKGEHPWDTGTRDYFESNGTGTGTQLQDGSRDLPTGQKALADTQTVAAYEKLRGKSA